MSTPLTDADLQPGKVYCLSIPCHVFGTITGPIGRITGSGRIINPRTPLLFLGLVTDKYRETWFHVLSPTMVGWIKVYANQLEEWKHL